MQFVMRSLGILRALLQKFGPYLMVEMLLPGGTLIALLLFLYQRRRLNWLQHGGSGGVHRPG